MSDATQSSRRLGVVDAAAQAALVVLAIVACFVGPRPTWDLSAIVVVGIFTVVSGLTYVAVPGSSTNIEGSAPGLILAAVLYGGAPAALLGAITICFMQLRQRSALPDALANLTAFVWSPLVAALVFEGLTSATGLGTHNIGFYVLVIPTFLISELVNFGLAVGHQCWLRKSSFAVAVREYLVPIVWVELLASLITLVAVWITIRTGTLGLTLLGVTFLVFQRLAGELMKSKSRAHELRRMATTDSLTGLVNRPTFVAELTEAITAAHSDTAFAVNLIDLDGFKEINDTLGHHYGDELLRVIAGRLRDCLGSAGTVARLGGDEFVVMCKDVAGNPNVAMTLAERLGERVREPIEIDEIAVTVGASIGIARFPGDGRDVNELLRRADVAMYTAKDAKSGAELYVADLDHHSVRRLSLMSEVSQALAAEQLVVHYQPLIAADDFSLQGVECLIRWQHPDHGLLLPGAFLELIEQTPLIHPLTLFVLESSIKECAGWRRNGRDLFVAVNLSVRNLHHPGLPDEIATMLHEHGLDPSALKLEITESTIMADPDLVRATIDRLHTLGVRLSIDDFGTGFSSLAYLKNLPIAELKIDQSFVSSMLQDESDLIIVRSTINLGHDLGLRVVAEGVEDTATLLKLSALGCDLVQGYHISRPVSLRDLEGWMSRVGHAPLHPAPDQSTTKPRT